MALRDSDAGILDAAERYLVVQAKANELLEHADDRLLTGSSGTVYLKRLGHRPLTPTDVEQLINALGSADDKQTLVDFKQAQQTLQERLQDTKAIGIVLEQADITKALYYYRAKQPSIWKPQEIINVIRVLERLQV